MHHEIPWSKNSNVKIKRDVLCKKTQCSYNLSEESSRKNETTRGKKKYCVKEYHGWERHFPLCLWMNLIKKAFHLFEEKRKWILMKIFHCYSLIHFANLIVLIMRLLYIIRDYVLLIYLWKYIFVGSIIEVKINTKLMYKNRSFKIK